MDERNSYSWPVVWATVVHLLALLLVVGQWFDYSRTEVKRPQHIQAQMFDLSSLAPQDDRSAQQAAEQARQQEQQRQAEQQRRAEEQRRTQEQQRAEEQRRAEQQRQEQQRQEQQRQEQQRQEQARQEAERKRQQELVAQREAESRLKAEQERQQQEAERRRQEEARKAAEEKRRQEEAAKRAADEKQRQEEAARRAAEEKRRQEEAARKAEEQRQREQAEQARQAAERQGAVIGDIQSYMAAVFAQNWHIPATARDGMEATVAIQLSISGEILNVRIVRSSGNAAFDRSVEQAVLRTAELPRVREIDPALFNRIRNTTVVFKPDGLRW